MSELQLEKRQNSMIIKYVLLRMWKKERKAYQTFYF